MCHIPLPLGFRVQRSLDISLCRPLEITIYTSISNWYRDLSESFSCASKVIWVLRSSDRVSIGCTGGIKAMKVLRIEEQTCTALQIRLNVPPRAFKLLFLLLGRHWLTYHIVSSSSFVFTSSGTVQYHLVPPLNLMNSSVPCILWESTTFIGNLNS